MDLKTGAIKWATRLRGYDVWTVASIVPMPRVTCPDPAGPDYDLGGSGPNLLEKYHLGDDDAGPDRSKHRFDMVGFGQKSGMYWAFNADNGDIVWSTVVGPGGSLGGIEWGTATDGRRIYVAIANNSHQPYTLMPSNRKITWGSWSALDARAGDLVWQTADPTPGALDTGSVSVANVSSMPIRWPALPRTICTRSTPARDRSYGSSLAVGSVIGGPSIVDRFVYWGSGYPRFGFAANNKLYAFTVKHRER